MSNLLKERWNRLAFTKGNLLLNEANCEITGEELKEGIPLSLWQMSDYEDAIDTYGNYQAVIAQLKTYHTNPELGYLQEKQEQLRRDIDEEMQYLDDLQNQYDSAIYPKETLISIIDEVIKGEV